jgi:hypothetical protein
LCFKLFNKIRGQNRFCLVAGVGDGEVAQTIYAQVSKCKNNKIKGRRKLCLFLTKYWCRRNLVVVTSVGGWGVTSDLYSFIY